MRHISENPNEWEKLIHLRNSLQKLNRLIGIRRSSFSLEKYRSETEYRWYISQPMGVVLWDIYEELLDEYVDCLPLNGIDFTTDVSEVHTNLVKFISENNTAE